jgi:hypothetical protein
VWRLPRTERDLAARQPSQAEAAALGMARRLVEESLGSVDFSTEAFLLDLFIGNDPVATSTRFI